MALAIEAMIDNEDDVKNVSFLNSFHRHRDQALQFLQRSMQKLKGSDNIFRCLSSFSLLIRQQTFPIDYIKLI